MIWDAIAPHHDDIVMILNGLHLHYRQKIWTSWKTQWKHSFFLFRFAECGLAPTTTHILWQYATLTCSVIDEKCNLQSSKSKIHNRIYRNVSFFKTSEFSKLKLPSASTVSLITLWIYGNFMYSIIRYWYHAKFVDRSPDNNLSAITKYRKVWLNVWYFVIWFLTKITSFV